MLKKLLFRSGSFGWSYRPLSGYSTSDSSTVQNEIPAVPTSLTARPYGQPTSDSHPHLLQKGQVTPGITLEEYQNRRSRLMESVVHYAEHITVQTKNHVVLIPSASKVFMSEKIPYPFRQNSDFFYLTGFLEPDSVLVLRSEPQHGTHKSIIFVPKRDPYSELWDGPRAGVEGALNLLGIDQAYNVEELPNFLSKIFRDCNSLALWYDFQNIPQAFAERTLKGLMAVHTPKFVNSHLLLLHQLRLFKSPAEASLLARSCQIASESFVDVMAYTRPGVDEHHLYAKMDCGCRLRGADRLGYPPVVAGGDRANIIHYVTNNQLLFEGELVLMDAGCEYGGYVSDITRTWPVDDKFSAPHRDLYEAVWSVQDGLIKYCEEGVSLDQIYRKMEELLGDKLQELNVINKSVSKTERSKLVHGYCPHHVGHYLGMDVHDTPLIPRSRPLQPGMVITIEPGIYIKRDDRSAPHEFRGVGIRIEDNVLMTTDGPKVLSSKCPKTVADIEAVKRDK